MTEAMETPQPQAIPSASVMAGPFLLEKLRALDARLEEEGLRVLASTDDENAVHDLRVALRPPPPALPVGRTGRGRFQPGEGRRALRDLQRATGELRDEEVLLELFASLGVVGLEYGAWMEARRKSERRLRRALVKSVKGGRLDSGRRVLEALLVFPVKPSRDRRLSKLARRSVEKARREVLRLRGAHTDDPDALHRLRIAYKRLRYVVETFAEALPPELAALSQPAARFQSRLGDLHDVDVAIGVVRRARMLPEASRQEVLAALERVRLERMAAYAREIGLVNIAPAPPVKAALRPPWGDGNSAAEEVAHPPSRGRRIVSH